MGQLKYTPAILAEAVAASASMADVMRYLGVRLTGGTHAHLRRRINQFGIDTTHFTGRVHSRGIPSPRRRSPEEILILRPTDWRRQAPTVLRRALEGIGRSYICEWCGIGDSWQGRPITLHVDHIDGEFSDCRSGNLRFLCPNCHSQTPTYAGRSRLKATEKPTGPLSEADKVEMLSRIERGELTISAAARLMGCHRRTVHRMSRRLASTGGLVAGSRTAPTKSSPQIPASDEPPGLSNV